MKLLNRLERRFSSLAIQNLTLYLVFFQSATYLLTLFSKSKSADSSNDFVARLALVRELVLQGQVWRLFTFVIIPPFSDPLWAAVALYFFYWVGTSMENHWGTFKYNIYLLIGYLCTVAAAMLVPGTVATNGFLLESIVVAFAWVFPDVTILLFFFFPCKMKWIGLLSWIILLVAFFGGDWGTRALVLAAVANFVIFFNTDLVQAIRLGKHRMAHIAKGPDRDEDVPFHVCAECGVSDKSNPKMEFRYCPQCTGTPCYCIDHIQKHQHQ